MADIVVVNLVPYLEASSNGVKDLELQQALCLDHHKELKESIIYVLEFQVIQKAS